MSADTSGIGGGARAAPAPMPRTPVAMQAATVAPKAAAAASAAAASGAASVELRPPEKVDVGFDAGEMRASLEEAVARLNEQARRSARNLNFSIDEVVDRTVITVRSSQTGEVVRQIPNEVVLKLALLLESMKGLMFDGSV